MADDSVVAFELLGGVPGPDHGAGPPQCFSIGEDFIAWRPAADLGAAEQRRGFAEIATVSLAVLVLGDPSAPQGACFITFSDGQEIVVVSYNERDEAEERLASAYRGFVDALHVRLAASGHAIRFLVGATPGDEAPINRALLLAGLLALVFVGVNWVAGGPWWGYAIVLLAAGVAAKFLLRPAPPQAEYDPRAIPPKLRIP